LNTPSAAPAPGFTLRHAGNADAGTLATLAARTFTETFGHLYPKDDLADFLAHTYTAAAYRALLTDPGHALKIVSCFPTAPPVLPLMLHR